MKKIVAIFIAATVALGSVTFVLKYANPPASFKKNVKMTVTVETPDGDVSGYAVREISNEAPRIKTNWPHGGNPASERGEAIVVDLGTRGKILGLVGDEERFYKAFPPPNSHPQSNEAMEYYAALPTGTAASLDLDYWPKFVMFTDINESKSVTLVRGHEFNPVTQKYDLVDNFAEFFGVGVKLKSVTLEIVNEPVTWGNVDRVIPSDFGELKRTWKDLPSAEKARINKLISFKVGED